MKHIRKRLTYANVISSIALFLALGGAAAVAANQVPRNSVGPRQLQPKAVRTGYIDLKAVRVGKIAPEAVRAGRLAKNAVTTDRLRNNAVATPKIRNNAVTGAKVNEATLGQVPSAVKADAAGNATRLGGHEPDDFLASDRLLWALVDENGALVDGSGASAAAKLGTGEYRVAFERSVEGCASEGAATDVDGGDAPAEAAARIVGTDNRDQSNPSTVDVATTDPAGAKADPAAGDGFTLTVHC